MIPWVLHGTSLGDNALEIGPGPGITTDLLRVRVARLTALEVDPLLARSLSRRLSGTNVTVAQQDATKMQFPDACFSGAVSMTMLHHLSSVQRQDQMFTEVARVLRPGGIFVGCDRVFRSRLDLTHLFDIKVPVPPESLHGRLRCAGFEKVQVEIRQHDFRFIAWKGALTNEQRD
jgi:ubiquinone/menaquinone biosynthesis C-methylase UbiE